jgi:hypothetical protein
VTVTASAPGLSASWYAAAERRRVVVIGALALLVALGYAWFTLWLPIFSPVSLFTVLLLVAVAIRPRLGLLFAFGMVLLFEQNNPDPAMQPGQYFLGGLQSTLNLTGLITSPLELLLLISLGAWLGRGLATRRLEARAGRLVWPVVLFLAAIVFGLARGLASGGASYIVLWESRFLFYLIGCYFLAANTIRTRQHVRQLLAVALVAVGAYGIEGVYRHFFLLDTMALDTTIEFAWSHDTAIYLGSFLLLVLAQAVFGAPRWQRLFGIALVPVVGFTMLATERRAGYIAVIVTFLAYALVFLVVHRKAFFLIAVPFVVCGALYFPLFWNNAGLVGQPARAVRSLFQPDPRDAASNLYRIIEMANVRATIRANPVTGVGFGREFYFVYSLPDLSWWPFWHYEPHANILWIWLKTGAFGFIVFWTLIGSALAHAAFTARRSHVPEARVFALFAISGIIGAMVFSYVDLGLVNPRVTVFLGTLLGALAVLDRIGGEDGREAGAPTSGESAAPPLPRRGRPNGAATVPIVGVASSRRTPLLARSRPATHPSRLDQGGPRVSGTELGR